MVLSHTYIGFLELDMINLIGLLIPLWLPTENSFKSSGKAFVILMVSKSERTSFKLFKLFRWSIGVQLVVEPQSLYDVVVGSSMSCCEE